MHPPILPLDPPLNSILYGWMNGNGEFTEMENVIFLRKLRCSYGILTDERNSCVLLRRTTEIRERRNGYVTVETTQESPPAEIEFAFSLNIWRQQFKP